MTANSFACRFFSARRTCVAASALAFLLALPGCSIPIPQAEADPTRYFVLSTSASPAATPAAAGVAIHLRPVEVASYLRTRPIVVRRGDHEIEFREFARWGEPLETGIGRVLREELLARGAATAVLAGGIRAPGALAAYELTVRVLAAEGLADGGVNFRATWELAPASGQGTPAAQRGDFRSTNLRWDGRNEGALAAQLSQAVSLLAGDIAAELAKK